MAFTYEQIELLFEKVLQRYCSHKYELHELVNAVWLAGRVQNAVKISHCVWLMKRDAIDYMRKCETRFVKKPRFVSITAITDSIEDGWEGGGGNDPFGGDEDEPIARVMSGELRQRLLIGLSRMEKLTMTMTWEGFGCREIGEVAGFTESHITQIRMRVAKIVRTRAKQYCGDEEKEHVDPVIPSKTIVNRK